jgi:hypothetical protein
MLPELPRGAVCDDLRVTAPQPHHVVTSVMYELNGLFDAVATFEDGVAKLFGLDQRELRWFVLLGSFEAGMTHPDLERASGLTGPALADVLGRLHAGGHIRATAAEGGRVALSPDARKLLSEVYATIDMAYVGLHRYSAEELGVVRTFLRIGRHFYERQAERLVRVAPSDPN